MSVAALLRGGAWGQAGTPADGTDASFTHWESAGELGRSLAEEAKIERDAKLYGSWVGTRYITDAERNLIIVAASISVLSLLALLYLYYIKRSPFMRRHPGHLTVRELHATSPRQLATQPLRQPANPPTRQPANPPTLHPRQ